LEVLRFASQHGGVRVREKAQHAIDTIERVTVNGRQEDGSERASQVA
jgi:hypothetical protein